MGKKLKKTVIVLILIFLVSCENKKQSSNDIFESKNKNRLTTNNSFKITESENQFDNPANEFLTEKLKPISENFKKINSVTNNNWSLIETKSLDETTEGGEATFYYLNADLRKIITKQYGETNQTLTEYYFLAKKLSFVLERNLKYNRPIYWDKTKMRENKDNEVFDFKKSKITEVRNYFENEKLIFQLIENQSVNSMSAEYLKTEQNRIKTKYF
jgi:hypothetical protein